MIQLNYVETSRRLTTQDLAIPFSLDLFFK